MLTEMQFVEGEDPCPSIEWHKKMTDEEYEHAIERLLSLCGDYGVEIERTNEFRSTFNPFDKVLTLSTRYGLKKTYFKLLHEIGHVLVGQELGLLGEDDPSGYFIHYPGFVGRSGVPHRTTKMSMKDFKRSTFSIIHEELDAWRKGIDIAHMLELPLGLHDYWEHASESVETYVHAYCDRS